MSPVKRSGAPCTGPPNQTGPPWRGSGRTPVTLCGADALITKRTPALLDSEAPQGKRRELKKMKQEAER